MLHADRCMPQCGPEVICSILSVSCDSTPCACSMLTDVCHDALLAVREVIIMLYIVGAMVIACMRMLIEVLGHDPYNI